jgi:hypothetical protein
MQTQQGFRVFIDGAVHFDLNDFALSAVTHNCSNSSELGENNFKISDYLTTWTNDFYEPMRGEITRVNIYDTELSEEHILTAYFKCAAESPGAASFLWSNVLIDAYLMEFKRKKSSFCTSYKIKLKLSAFK